MKSFLKYTLATIVGVIVSSIVLVLILVGIVGGIIASADKEVTINANSILKIDLSKPIPDRTSDNPFENFNFRRMRPNVTLGLNDITRDILAAKTDPNIKGIYLDLSMIPAGWGSIEEIRNALLDFRKSKKFIISYADYYSQGAYYIATASDSIFLNPMGELAFLGMRSEVMFFKGSFEKLDIEPEIIRHGKFKSAVEPLISDKMSPENREQLTVLLSGLWNHILEGISAQRKISIPELNRLASGMTISNAQAALDHKMIDGVRYKDEIIDRLVKLSGAASEKKLSMVELNKYDKAAKPVISTSKNKIALVYASGEIQMGDGDEDNIGSEKLSKTIRKIRKDTSIKAIVLRINSPGGSALASDIIWRELELAAKVKPLIVSMGSLAASGGYYIAAPAHTIIAEPTTITGSIGVFGVMFNVKNFMGKKLGITTDVAQTNDHADLGSIYRPLTAQEHAIVLAEVEHVYDVFITRVSEGRKMSKAAVDSIGQGRVWSAIDAKRKGLVDEIGGIDRAFEIAAKKAKLKEYRIVELPEQEDPLTAFLNDFSTKMKNDIIHSELGEQQNIYDNLKGVMSRKGILMRMPYEINAY
jgi:protease IV